tara:strand:- start:94 stop:459 length:366 start_codon:yes stop_codon:yes gene_type:complete
VDKQEVEVSEGEEVPGTQIRELIYFCEKCDYFEKKETNDSSVFHLNYNLDVIKRNHIVNQYTAYDPTLPKALGIKCPNEGCPSKTTAKKPEIRYIKYDDTNMKYIYICIDCHRAKIEPNTW